MLTILFYSSPPFSPYRDNIILTLHSPPDSSPPLNSSLPFITLYYPLHLSSYHSTITSSTHTVLPKLPHLSNPYTYSFPLTIKIHIPSLPHLSLSLSFPLITPPSLLYHTYFISISSLPTSSLHHSTIFLPSSVPLFL